MLAAPIILFELREGHEEMLIVENEFSEVEFANAAAAVLAVVRFVPVGVPVAVASNEKVALFNFPAVEVLATKDVEAALVRAPFHNAPVFVALNVMESALLLDS
jgi:hypothetical protein